MMGNHEIKKAAAERHNAHYAACKAETQKPQAKPVKRKPVNVGSIGHIDQDKKTLSQAVNKASTKSKCRAWWRRYSLPDACWALLVVGAFSNLCYWVV